MNRIIALLRAFLSRFFARKSPIGFDQEIGSWVEPDVTLSPSPTVPAPPQPLINNDCNRSHVIYSVALNVVPACTFAEKLKALSEAVDNANRYFNNHFRCQNEKCTQKVGDVIWVGVSCGKTAPITATAAVLVRFRCEVEL